MSFALYCPALTGNLDKDKWMSLGTEQNKGFTELTMRAAENVTGTFLRLSDFLIARKKSLIKHKSN